MHPSPVWQTAFLFGALVFLVWQTLWGWRVGLFRGGINLAAILVSTVLGRLAAELAASPFGGLHTLSGLIAGLVVGGGLGIFAFLAIWFFGVVVFKRTEHHAFGPLRILWGAGGALFGFLIGLAIVSGSISVVRSLGALAELQVETASPDQPRPMRERVAVALVTLKQSLELGSIGHLLESIDILPSNFYELILQVGKLAGDQEKMARFLDYPPIQEVLKNPRIAELMSDPDFIRAARDKNFFMILNNKAVAAAIRDPLLAQQLQKVDLHAALKFAMEPPAPPHSSPSSPSPKKRR
jgi:hypothetical protein